MQRHLLSSCVNSSICFVSFNKQTVPNDKPFVFSGRVCGQLRKPCLWGWNISGTSLLLIPLVITSRATTSLAVHEFTQKRISLPFQSAAFRLRMLLILWNINITFSAVETSMWFYYLTQAPLFPGLFFPSTSASITTDGQRPPKGIVNPLVLPEF